MTAKRPDTRLTKVFAVVAIYLGLFWTWAGLAKAIVPGPAYEFTARVVGGGLPAKSVVTAFVLLETLLGLALLARVVSRRLGLGASLALLIAFTSLLVLAKSAGGGALSCGCFAFFATSSATVDRELWINGGHAAILAVLLVAGVLAERRVPAAA